jgi:hypothetical protein
MKTGSTILLALACFSLGASAQTLANYQAIVLGQGPSSYFTFDGGSLTSVAGSPVTLSYYYSAGSSSFPFNYDIFGNPTNAIYFTASTDTAYDTTHHLINGGGTATTNSTATGSITLLFRTLDPGPPPSGAAGQHFVFSAGGTAGASNTFALLIENTNSGTVDPGSFKVRFGDASTTILQATNIVPDAWYYFALTYNEAATNSNGSPNTNKANWYLGRLSGGGTLASGTTINTVNANAVAGDGTDFFIGAQTTFASGLRNPGDGRVDEVALWSRQLTTNEIQAQFTNLPNVALPPRATYQSVITNQSPSHYFQLNGNPVDSAIGSSLVLSINGSAPQLGYGCDYFEVQSNACYFSASPDALVASANLLNGGGTYTGALGNGKGSISCLFHPLAGTNYTGQKFIFSAGGSTGTSNGFALFFESASSAYNPLSLKIRFGDSTDVILPVTNFFSEWYYFAMTYDETQPNKQVNWWLARPGMTLQTGFFSATIGSLAGEGDTFYIGNSTDAGSGFRAVNTGRQSNGQVDEFTIWNRLLTTNEVAAQFSALSVSAGPPPKLSIAISGSNAILSWPSSTDSGYGLQSTTNLASPNWLSAGASAVVGTNNVVTNSISGSAQFYRLKK